MWKTIRNWPILALYIELPFVRISTRLFTKSFEKDAYEYVLVFIEIWKWKFDFNLYTTRHRRYEDKHD